MLENIGNQTDYNEYKKRVSAFFKTEGLSNLQSMSNDPESYFSHQPCDCCTRSLDGDRYDCNGYNLMSKEIQEYYSICMDCYYYAEYGQLDDMTMLDYNLV